MAIHIKTSGERIEVHPANGKTFTLEELQGYVGGYIERVCLDDGRELWLDEEGKLKGKPVNLFATQLTLGLLFAGDMIVGDVLLTNLDEQEQDDEDG